MKLYGTGKVAEMLGMNEVTVIGWIRQGMIKAVRVGREYYGTRSHKKVVESVKRAIGDR